MPFASKRQQRAAFGGHIPGISKKKAREWAHETPDLKNLPERAKKASVPKGLVRVISIAGRGPVRRGARVAYKAEQKAADAYERIKHSHFTKIADLLMGMGQGAGQLGAGESRAAKAVWDVPVNSSSARGSGYQTPSQPKKPGHSIKKQSTNPRANLRDAMTKGIA